VRTVGKALEKTGPKPRIYICAAPYADSVKVSSSVSLYGGFNCTGWSYTGEHAKFTSAPDTIALTMTNVSSSVVADLDFEAPDATAKGGSSIAGFISGGTVTFRRTSFKAGKGQPGEDAPASGGVFAPVSAETGSPGTASTGGGQLKNSMYDTSIGGPGAPPLGPTGTGGFPGAPKLVPSVPDTATGSGGTGTDCGGTATGRTGSHGPGGVLGNGAKVLGKLSANGWTPEGGESGGPGSTAQGGGGGGGGASTDGSGGGGGGGPGGCGGSGGSGGHGGGASIAIVVQGASLSFDFGILSASAAGRGGSGGGGQTGQAGGSPGTIASGDQRLQRWKRRRRGRRRRGWRRRWGNLGGHSVDWQSALLERPGSIECRRIRRHNGRRMGASWFRRSRRCGRSRRCCRRGSRERGASGESASGAWTLGFQCRRDRRHE